MVFGARRRATSAWVAKETHFLEIIPPVTILKVFCFTNPLLKIKRKGICIVDNEVVGDLRRITRAYMKKIGGLPIIFVLPRREYHKKYRPKLEDSVLVEDIE